MCNVHEIRVQVQRGVKCTRTEEGRGAMTWCRNGNKCPRLKCYPLRVQKNYCSFHDARADNTTVSQHGAPRISLKNHQSSDCCQSPVGCTPTARRPLFCPHIHSSPLFHCGFPPSLHPSLPPSLSPSIRPSLPPQLLQADVFELVVPPGGGGNGYRPAHVSTSLQMGPKIPPNTVHGAGDYGDCRNESDTCTGIDFQTNNGFATGMNTWCMQPDSTANPDILGNTLQVQC